MSASDYILIAAFTAGEWVLVSSSVIASLATAVVSIIQASKTNAKLDEVHRIANSLSDKRNEATSKAAHAEGMLDEKAAQQLRRDIRAGAPLDAPKDVTIVNPPSQPVPTVPVNK